MALAALLGATAVPGVLPLQAQTFCFFGAGQVGVGQDTALYVPCTACIGCNAMPAWHGCWIWPKSLVLAASTPHVRAGVLQKQF